MMVMFLKQYDCLSMLLALYRSFEYKYTVKDSTILEYYVFIILTYNCFVQDSSTEQVQTIPY